MQAGAESIDDLVGSEQAVSRQESNQTSQASKQRFGNTIRFQSQWAMHRPANQLGDGGHDDIDDEVDLAVYQRMHIQGRIVEVPDELLESSRVLNNDLP